MRSAAFRAELVWHTELFYDSDLYTSAMLAWDNVAAEIFLEAQQELGSERVRVSVCLLWFRISELCLVFVCA